MLFPRKDNIPLARLPIVTVALVALNVVYLLEIRHGTASSGPRPTALRFATARSRTS